MLAHRNQVIEFAMVEIQKATLLSKEEKIKKHFSLCKTPEEMYQALIALGKKLPPFPQKKTPDQQVTGCQSIVFIGSHYEKGVIDFFGESNALITAGLVYLLVDLYSGESPETIIQHSPSFLETLGIPSALTPSRANGLYQIHTHMQREALRQCLHSQ